MNELDVLKDVSNKLESAGIPFMLTGSLAMSYYAQPRMTRDIDIVVELHETFIKSFTSLFSSEYYILESSVSDAVKNEAMFNIIHNHAIVKVDFIVKKSSDYRLLEFNRRVKVRLSDFYSYIVSKEDLIISKLIWMHESNSDLQKRDIINLLKTGVDENYLFRWISKFNLNQIFDTLKNG